MFLNIKPLKIGSQKTTSVYGNKISFKGLFAGVGGVGEEAVSDLAVEAFVGFAVLAPQFDEGL